MFADTREAQNELGAGYSKEELEIISSFFQRITAIWEHCRDKL